MAIVNIVFGNNNEKSLTIEIFDLQARRLFNKTIEGNAGSFTLNIGTFANGPLYLRITDKNNNLLNSSIIIKN